MKRLSNFTLIVVSFFLLSTLAVIAINNKQASAGRSEIKVEERRDNDANFYTLNYEMLHLPCLAPFTLQSSSTSFMPPSEVGVISSLKARSVIPKEATEVDTQRIYKEYLTLKLGKRPEDRPNFLGARQIAQGEKSEKIESHHGIVKPLPGIPVKSTVGEVRGTEQSAQGEEKGDGGTGAEKDSPFTTTEAQASEIRIDHILILLVEFAGTDDSSTGPLHNAIPQPDRKINLVDYWTPDFSEVHYEHMLFDRASGARSMSNYYLEQSGGVYTVGGNAYGWFKVNHAEWYYGADSPEGGIDNLNGPVWRLVEDAVKAAGDSVPWADYDKEDPYDMDGDGIYDEPDGYVDHIMIVHAGLGQEAGGGQQGDSSIWSHSWWANKGSGGPGFGGVPTSNPKVWAGAYTMMPENGTLGVFCHEFGHDLGLPDEYDTIYSGEASTAFWTLMGSGGWLSTKGEPYLGTCPANFSIWCKYVLGWVNPVMVNPGKGSKKFVNLKPVEGNGSANKAIRVNLPPYNYTNYVNEPHSPGHEWYSDKGDNLNQTLTRLFALPISGATLKFWTWYDIEQDWDYGCVEVSADGGASWQVMPGNITTTANPNGQNPGHGITGQSGDWVQAVFDLSGYSGKNVLVRFRYWTDGAAQGLGWTIDDIELVDGSGGTGSVIFSDDVEFGPRDWLAYGWRIFGGSENLTAFHYYLAEWRQPIGFDASMNGWYNSTYNAPPYKLIERFSADPGLLLWYRDGQFSAGDNYVGNHPWKGFLLLVDSHPDLIEAPSTFSLANMLYGILPHVPDGPSHPLNQNLPFGTRIQIADAAFGRKPTIESPLTSWYGISTPGSKVPKLAPVSVFDDSITYVDTSWSPWFLCWVYDAEYGWQDYGQFIRRSINSVDTPSYGLKIEVIREESDKTATVMVDFSGFPVVSSK